MKRMDKRKDREEVEEECDNERSEMDIEVGGDEMEGVEDEMEALVSSVWSNGVDNL